MPDISDEEFDQAEKSVFKLIQKEIFAGETDSKLKFLKSIEDENGILRRKTCLINGNDIKNFRFPILLPSQHPVVESLIFHNHLKNQHADFGVLVSSLREITGY